ncbi:MAG TPA: peptide-N-glycosidase F-related protein [Adhaeribacter sp.]|nr:peptide-N-glycosidase F-related protein [Adhaeribacter sp.]
MKNTYRFCLFLFIALFSLPLKAAPGDTTAVQSHISTQLANYGNYDQATTFPVPGTSYQRINMTFTLGKYSCPGSPQYCGDWDYTVLVYLLTPTDTLEIGRLITPYANVSRFPMSWTHRYVFDVTDYAAYLKNNANIRIKYSGYSGGFTANIKFDFIEGTPPRNVVEIKKVWSGYFNYGNTASIEAQVANRTLQMPATAQSAALKLFLTGHGGNANDNCAEFCIKYYRVKLNNNHLLQQTIWRDNCGENNLYPQTGTWLYDRANWCPGDLVTPYLHDLPAVTAGSPLSVDVDFEPYMNSTSQAGWQLEGQVIFYGPYNHTTDAALEHIISPSDHEAFFRDNQVCQEPKIEVKNNGSTALTSLEIQYGLLTGNLQTYQWTGNIPAGEKAEIALPTIPEIQNITAANVKFTARISQANGSTDANTLNNEKVSTFTPLPVWPNNLVFTFTTNRASLAGYNQTTWKLYDAAGNIVSQRLNNPNQATLRDTLALPRGCYRLEMEDSGCDGINWWAYQFYQPNPGNGSFIVRENGKPGPQLSMRGYFNGDFGCSFSQTFYVANALGISTQKVPFSLAVYPNPASELLLVNISGMSGLTGQITLTNTLGQQIYHTTTTTAETNIPVKQLAAGVYILSFRSGQHSVQKQVVITH